MEFRSVLWVGVLVVFLVFWGIREFWLGVSSRRFEFELAARLDEIDALVKAAADADVDQHTAGLEVTADVDDVVGGRPARGGDLPTVHLERTREPGRDEFVFSHHEESTSLLHRPATASRHLCYPPYAKTFWRIDTTIGNDVLQIQILRNDRATVDRPRRLGPRPSDPLRLASNTSGNGQPTGAVGVKRTGSRLMPPTSGRPATSSGTTSPASSRSGRRANS